jgi:hypothetical protein
VVLVCGAEFSGMGVAGAGAVPGIPGGFEHLASVFLTGFSCVASFFLLSDFEPPPPIATSELTRISQL